MPAATGIPTPTPIWTFCANENSTCTVSGTRLVRFGSGTTFVTKSVTSSIACTRSAFGSDPTPGITKHCDYQ